MQDGYIYVGGRCPVCEDAYCRCQPKQAALSRGQATVSPEVIDELVADLRAYEAEADKIEAGCKQAVTFGQAHRMITLLYARSS